MRKEPSAVEEGKIAAVIFSSDRIQSINIYMSITGCGLTEAQDYVMAKSRELRESKPEKFKGNKPKQRLFGLFSAS